MRKMLPLLFGLLMATATLAGPIESGPLTPLSGDAAGAGFHPDVAGDGQGGFLVVWQRGGNYLGTAGGDLFARRIELDGRPSGAAPRVISHAPGSQERPRIAFAHGLYLVVWQDLRNGRDWDVYAARITPEGRNLDPQGIRIAGGPDNQALPVVAAANNGFLIVWQDRAGSRFYRLAWAGVNGKGQVRPGKILRYQGPDAGLWQGYTPGWGYGKLPLDTDRPASGELHGGQPELSRSKDGWTLAWVDESNWAPGNQGGITRRFARLRETGDGPRVEALLRPESNAIGRSGGHFARGHGRLLYAGWGILNRGVSVATALLLEDGGLQPLANPNPEPPRFGAGWKPARAISLFQPGFGITGSVATAPTRNGFLVAAAGDPRLPPPHRLRIYASRLDAEGRRLDRHPDWPILHQGQSTPANPALAASGDSLLLAFEQDDASGSRRIYARRLRMK
ncbi:hypothetical protein QVG61_07870 [Thiohalobacter sp. IOR34]|uniref:hypothetical protein n=1 Tax=Thiohalobacter sp. IOR34 TaxID=3057176 RepID=UPI0025B169D5|nr:hypothetical protein [Thiohalobacter sp. IOR34]WJW74434.1 hypothetical protein QVG61_07870 [Thiohalobacter sp. IOR34]